MNTLKKILARIEESGLYPDNFTLSCSQSPEVTVGEKQLLMFCSNNYLNLSTHPRVIRAAQNALAEFGTGSGGSRHISGTNEHHLELESTLAALKGREDALVFSSGYLANIAAISTIANPLASISIMARPLMKELSTETVVFSDELNHASIIDACKIAGRKCLMYKHSNMKDLERKIIQHRHCNKIIISDGVFSMDGDIAPLPDIVDIATKYEAFIILDDAHSTGLLGKNGGGTAEHFGLEGKVDLEVGTLNKVFGAVGGFIAGDRDVCKLLRATARTYIFSASMPPSVAAGISESVRILMEDDTLRNKLYHNISTFERLAAATSIPFKTPCLAPIIPIIIGDESKTISIARALYQEGIFLPAVTWPAVPKGKARLRLTLMSHHTEEQIMRLVNTLQELCKKISMNYEKAA